MEYLIITAFSLIALSLALLIITDQIRTARLQASSSEAVRLLDTLTRMIRTVSWEGPGSVPSMTIPTPPTAYNLSGGDGFILLTIRTPDGTLTTATRRVDALVNASIRLPGVESLPTYRVANENGTITITLTQP